MAGLAAALTLTWNLAASDDSDGVKWHFPIGIQYFSGLNKVMDTVEELNFGGYDFDEVNIPVGLVASPYAEFDFGLGVGITVGPPTLIFIQENYFGPGFDSSTDYFTYIVPVGMDLRYTFLRDGSISPFVRAGFRYPIAGGDFIDSATLGFNGGVGVEFMRNKRVGFGVEVGCDTSEVKIESRNGLQSKTVKPVEFTIGVFALF